MDRMEESNLTPFAVIPRYSYEQQLNQKDAKVAIQYASDFKKLVLLQNAGGNSANKSASKP